MLLKIDILVIQMELDDPFFTHISEYIALFYLHCLNLDCYRYTVYVLCDIPQLAVSFFPINYADGGAENLINF